MLTQESLATLMTGMMAQTGTLGQPLLIPFSMAGSIAGQGSLAVLTLPTTSVATLPGLAAANPAGNLLKLPFAGLQGMDDRCVAHVGSVDYNSALTVLIRKHANRVLDV